MKSLFERLGVGAKVVELDELADGSKVQDALSQVCGRRTVPQVRRGGVARGGVAWRAAAGTARKALLCGGCSAGQSAPSRPPHPASRCPALPPQVFIGGTHVGGCDDTLAAYNSGKLKALFEQAGVQAKL